MTVLQRLAKIKELGQKKRTLASAIELNALHLENVADVKDLLHMPGWQWYESELRKDLNNKRRRLQELGVDPEANKWEISQVSAVCATIDKQLSFFRGFLSKERLLIDEQTELQEAAHNNNFDEGI